MVSLVRQLTGYSFAVGSQRAANQSKASYQVLADSETISEGSWSHSFGNGLKMISIYPLQVERAQSAWRSVEFKSKVGSVALGLTTIVLLGAAKSMQNKSSHKILPAILACVVVNLTLLRATFSVWREAHRRVDFSRMDKTEFNHGVDSVTAFLKAVQRDGLKALYSGATFYVGNIMTIDLLSHTELLQILKDLKNNYGEAYRASGQQDPAPESFGAFLSSPGNGLFKVFSYLPYKHPFRIAIVGMFEAVKETTHQPSLMNKVSLNLHQFMVENDGNVALFKALDLSTSRCLSRETIIQYHYQAFEGMYDAVIQELEETDKVDNWNEFCEQQYCNLLMSQFFEQFFKDVCSGKDKAFVSWLKLQIENFPHDKENKGFLLSCLNRACPQT